ncbi:GNAT family N-acetyltransferase [Alphaproteobacteria bacterium GH1-50]|uniref:GNAT family N-acetyltransferase n=1 Tax=Kangsaoukella pontilimi TaxID=2691042 RepID=A0A7C9NCC6_9RHOB|nr:GNAT family N-acetyltransferase [Kangsaoukella pontilimi]MXQ06579.1 GNAT family N-acetyltransferase [Kangsaoukella pontilimi]
MTGTPTPQQVFDLLDRTWPALRMIGDGPWTLREGAGGGQRVSAATARSTVTDADIDRAEAGMRGLGQRPLFMVRPEDGPLDAWLDTRGYEVVDPVHIYAARTESLARDLKPTLAYPVWPPVAAEREIWAEGGIGPARLAIMERATCPRVSILARSGNRPAAAVYVGAEGGLAMLHALETRASERRKGVGRTLVHAAANWARETGAAWLTLAVTRANEAANALYADVGMTVITGYHYRRAPKAGA